MPLFLFFLTSGLLKQSDDDTKRKALIIVCCVNALLYLFYKIIQANDPEYGFELLTNLPLHFCNINLILLPLAIFSKNKTLTSYQVYFGTPLAALALLTVDPVFRSKPLLEITCLFYFYYHSMLVVLPFILVKLD